MGDDGSSTGTEPEQHVQIPISGCKRSSRSSGARASKPAGSDRWVLFLEKFNLKLSQNKSGCSLCLKDCLLKIQPLLRELQHWREELAALPSEAQDKEIWWIFQKQAVSSTSISVRSCIARCYTAFEARLMLALCKVKLQLPPTTAPLMLQQ